MNTPTILAGAAAVKDKTYFEQTVTKVIKTREWTKQQLKKLGFVFGDSMSNFIFATHPEYKAVDIMNYLREKDIYVRHFNQPERISQYLRISIGTDEQMHIFVDHLKEFIEK